MPNTQDTPSHFYSDKPSGDPQKDRLNRRPFAERLAALLASRGDPASIVVGIHGKWGEGKSTVLEYLHEALCKYDRVVPVRFNPWRVGDEDRLLRGFFRTVAQALNRPSSTKWDQIGKLLRDYGEAIPTFGKAVSATGQRLAQNTPEDQKDRIEKALHATSKRIVVLMDDIDRLDRSEAQAVIRLLKLTGNFDYLDYVVAFDRDVVADAISERYATRGPQAGYDYLQKVLQVNLDLPAADPTELARLSKDFLIEGLRNAGLELSAKNWERFESEYQRFVAPALKTPRTAKQHANSAVFALGLLRGEVNAVDVLLMEAVKVLYPSLYAGIRQSPWAFTGDREDIPLDVQMNAVDWSKQCLQHVRSQMEALDPGERFWAERLILHLFPQISPTGNQDSQLQDLPPLAEPEQRICAPGYLQRYLGLAVPPGDIRDGDVDQVLQSGSEQELGQRLNALVGKTIQHRTLIQKLRQRLPSCPTDMRAWVLTWVCQNCSSLDEEGLSGASSLPAAIIRLEEVSANRLSLAEKVVQGARTLDFAFECLKSLADATHLGEPLFSDEERAQIQAALADRVAEAAKSGDIRKVGPSTYVPLLVIWPKTDPVGAKDYVEKWIQEDPFIAENILRHLGKLSTNNLALLDRIADRTLLRAALQKAGTSMHQDAQTRLLARDFERLSEI